MVPLFQRLASSGSLPITDTRMSRFWIILPQAVQSVVDSFERMHGGEIFVPRIPSTIVLDVAAAIAPDAEIDVVGIRPGEKLHEEMISEDDAQCTYVYDDHYVIAPVLAQWAAPESATPGKLVPEGFFYRSDTNDQWLDVAAIRELIAAL